MLGSLSIWDPHAQRSYHQEQTTCMLGHTQRQTSDLVKGSIQEDLEATYQNPLDGTLINRAIESRRPRI